MRRGKPEGLMVAGAEAAIAWVVVATEMPKAVKAAIAVIVLLYETIFLLLKSRLMANCQESDGILYASCKFLVTYCYIRSH